MPNQNPSYTWDGNVARYRDAAGQFVKRSVVRAGVEAVIQGAQIEIVYHCERLAGGVIDIPQWQTEMAQTIRSLHTVVAVAAKGGWAAMGPADWGRVGALTKPQYQYLARFAGEIASGAVDLQSGALVTRAKMYGEAAILTYETTATGAALAAPGLRFEYNVLGDADHCDDCLNATAAGRVPIGTLPRPGARQCQTHCRCRLEYA